MPTKIEWTHVPNGSGGFKRGETWNPQVGCREVSPGCRECYAAKQAHRSHGAKVMVKQHHGLTVMRADADGQSLGAHWNGKINRVPHLLAQPLRWREPRGIFVCSMSDLFFDADSDDACRWIAAIFGVMAACPQHTFMVLTKRPENAERWFAWLDREHDEAWAECIGSARTRLTSIEITESARSKVLAPQRKWPLPNVWVGVTAEDQRRADERVPVLLDLPAAVRFVSYEPALGPVDWTPWLSRLDWVICGGESGPGARPMHPDWARSARDQCEATGTAFFFKQWGEWLADDETRGGRFPDDPTKAGEVAWSTIVESSNRKEEGTRVPWAVDAEGEFHRMRRVGKGEAGRELDGRTHDGFPKASR